jgi:hypothetical protein
LSLKKEGGGVFQLIYYSLSETGTEIREVMIMVFLNSELITRRRRETEMWVRQVVLEIKAEADAIGIYVKEN